MSIKKRLILSNLGMIIIPILAFFLIEIGLGLAFFVWQDNNMEEDKLRAFVNYRFLLLLLVVIITNGVLTYLVSRTIIGPIQQLILAAKHIKAGHLDKEVQTSYQGELGELATTFEAMRKSLKEAQDVQKKYETNRRELISSISHDLRTPVTSIKGYVQGVTDGVANTPEKLDRYMTTIGQKTNELERMVDELFLYSKLDLDRVPFHFMPIDIDQFLRDIIDEWAFQYPDIKWEYQIKANVTKTVRADREQLYRAVVNILNNCLKYRHTDALKINIAVEQQGDYLKLMIRDNGIGIAKEALPFIFDQFYRSDESRNSTTGGSGIGLAIVKKIIEAHGGKVYAESEVNQGTAVYFLLKSG
ncbi:sensor histidine kinase [Gracilibacillus alcaliphilus]|uniref:sensor histidine kinase n=1 Tax=Gracilibacillus alcaliphilus TaxID=1401441 RepID=UPI00195E3DFA|nr:HAMP domain-containing sensor histidine kinase [Gracilibacillus alcaliphilus]MBM7676326.1 histidine kinase [Gracilibacillus alcaliphilus]